MKAVILKPIMWNSTLYTKPSGVPSKGGFARQYGYGHEEWNNNPGWIWHGYRVFHTEAPTRLLEYSAGGELGIIMTASYESQQYAVGAAMGVFDNSEEDRDLIAKELHLWDNWADVWAVPLVQARFDHDKSAFLTHWKQNYKWVRWKVDPQNYLWFRRPFPLDPRRISGKTKLASMHSKYQPIDADVAATIVRPNAPNAKHSCYLWLKQGDFDESFGSLPKRRVSSRSRGGAPAGKGPGTAAFPYSYWVEGVRTAEPLHARLQSKFLLHLQSQGITCIENNDNVDVQYVRDGRTVFCEIKPTDNVPTKYAIRFAVGQLLEYQHLHNRAAVLEIVLGSRPTNVEVNFVKSLGMRLTYWEEASSKVRTLLEGSA